MTFGPENETQGPVRVNLLFMNNFISVLKENKTVTMNAYGRFLALLCASAKYLSIYDAKPHIVDKINYSNEAVKALDSLPRMRLGFDYQTQRHMWVEFLGSLLCSEKFFSGFIFSWGAVMVQWWEYSPPTNVARVRFAYSASHVGWIVGSLLWSLFLESPDNFSGPKSHL